jgi:C4-dicarboxylate transporter DctM subunit
MIIAGIRAKRMNWPKEAEGIRLQKVRKSFVDAILAIIMPIIVLGGIYSGIFTPTESACIAVIYSFIVGVFVYREISLKDIPEVLYKSATASAMPLFILATSNAFAWLFVYAGFTKQLVGSIIATNPSVEVFLMVMTVIILIFGTFMDSVAIMVLLMPLFQPIAVSLHVHPIHLGMIVSVGIVIGCFTPPVASNLFAAVVVSKLPMGKIAWGQMPYFIVMLCVLLAIVIFPPLSTFLVK